MNRTFTPVIYANGGKIKKLPAIDKTKFELLAHMPILLSVMKWWLKPSIIPAIRAKKSPQSACVKSPAVSHAP